MEVSIERGSSAAVIPQVVYSPGMENILSMDLML